MTLATRLGLMVRGFPADPHRYGPQIRDLRIQNPDEFLSASAAVLREAKEAPGTSFLLATVFYDGKLIPLLFELAQARAPALDRILRASLESQPTLSMDIIKLMGQEQDESRLLVYLRILELANEGPKIAPLLRKLMASQSVKLRSKATLLMGQVVFDQSWFLGQMDEADERVRANAVEALWPLDLPKRKAVFERAVRDTAPRVIANGWIGLYLTGAAESLKGLSEMAKHADSGCRASAAWAMGYVADPRLAPTLEALKNDPSERVVSNAAKALERTQACKTAPPETEGEVRFLRAVPGSSDFLVLAADGRPLTQLRAIDVVTDVAGAPVLDYTLTAPAPTALVVAAIIPRWKDNGVLTGLIRHMSGQRRAAEEWKSVPYFERSEPAKDGEVSSNGAGLELPEVLLRAVRDLGECRKSRHLVVMLPAELAPSPWPADRMEPLAREIADACICVHVICEGSPWRGWRQMIDRSGGYLFYVDSLETCGDSLSDLSRGLLYRWRLDFAGVRTPPAAELSISVRAGGLLARGATRLAIVRKRI